MYCNKCGKRIAEGEVLCEECKAEEARKATAEREVDAYFGENASKPASTKYTRMYGFGPALAGAITSVSGFAFMLVAFIYRILVIVARVAQRETNEVIPEELFIVFSALIIAFVILGLICSLIGLIFSIKAINLVKEAKANGVKPIAAMVLSIIGTVSAGVALAICLITMVVLFI